jgi:hypothetical protein
MRKPQEVKVVSVLDEEGWVIMVLERVVSLCFFLDCGPLERGWHYAKQKLPGVTAIPSLDVT